LIISLSRKIKNLQKAGFTIDEIRGLLDKDNLAICRAFDEKIAKEEKRLQEIKDIRQSYQTEMNNTKNKIDAVRKKITEEMQAYNQASEFGLHADKYGEKEDKTAVENWFESTKTEVTMESVTKNKLVGYKFVNPNAKKWIFVVHGYTSDAKKMAKYIKRFYDMGYSVFAPDLIAHGKI